jgi:hypothetical protein
MLQQTGATNRWVVRHASGIDQDASRALHPKAPRSLTRALGGRPHYEDHRLTERTWIGQGSGPLLLLPYSLLPHWSGIDPPRLRIVAAIARWRPGAVRASDYDRACDVAEDAGLIPVERGHGLVLSQCTRATAWSPSATGGRLVRRMKTADAALVERAAAAPPTTVVWHAVGDWQVSESRLVLFNSAEPGVEPLTPRMELELAPATYAIRWARFTLAPGVEVGLIDLVRGAA